MPKKSTAGQNVEASVWRSRYQDSQQYIRQLQMELAYAQKVAAQASAIADLARLESSVNRAAVSFHIHTASVLTNGMTETEFNKRMRRHPNTAILRKCVRRAAKAYEVAERRARKLGFLK